MGFMADFIDAFQCLISRTMATQTSPLDVTFKFVAERQNVNVRGAIDNATALKNNEHTCMYMYTYILT